MIEHDKLIIEMLDAIESRMDERHKDIKDRLDRINGSVSSHAEWISSNRERLLAHYAVVQQLQEIVGTHAVMLGEQRGGMKMAVVLGSLVGGIISLVGGALMAHFLKG